MSGEFFITRREELNTAAELFPTITDAQQAIDDCKQILKSPVQTSYILSDPHGEADAFENVVQGRAGQVRKTVESALGVALPKKEIDRLCALISYGLEKITFEVSCAKNANLFYKNTVAQLAVVCAKCASEHCSSNQLYDMLTALRSQNAIDEARTMLSTAKKCNYSFKKLLNRKAFKTALSQAIDDEEIEDVIFAFCCIVRTLVGHDFYIVGDIYDRGPAPDEIMELVANLNNSDSVSLQWGNHDIVWMGAALGQAACIAHVVRNCARYGNLNILNNTYGVDLMPLCAFATKAYKNDECKGFGLKVVPEEMSEAEVEMTAKIQKAMAIIQFKVEAALIDEYPEFGLEDRKLLHKIDFEHGTVKLDGVEYELTDKVFPTINPSNPYELTSEEKAIVEQLQDAFETSEKLQYHAHLMFACGSMYEIVDNNLLFHACVPLNEDGSFKEVNIFGQKCKGAVLYNVLEEYILEAFQGESEDERKRGRDLMWYMWLGQGSPLFAKSKMATFEIYLIADKAARKEVKNPFYSLVDNEEVVENILEEFGVDKQKGRIICGHVPVKVKDGENPVKCNGKLLMIDGGFSRAYQPTTGIAGMSVVSTSKGVYLQKHSALESRHAAIEENAYVKDTVETIVEYETEHTKADTEEAEELNSLIRSLEQLISLYEDGILEEGELLTDE